jgi:hypothetical protein
VNVTLFGKAVFADAIKLRILRGDHLDYPCWQNPVRNPLRRKRWREIRNRQKEKHRTELA